LLLLKEDLAMVTLAMAVIIALRRHRRAGALLAAVSITWTVVIVFGVMPLLRQGEASDLALRYSYLFEGSSLLELIPVAIYRGAVHLSHNTLLPIGRILASGGIVGLLSPFTMLLTAPNLLISGLATHPQQSRLELHYSVPTLALVWVSVAFGLEQASRLLRGRALALSMVGTALLAIAALTFFVWSPYAPGRAQSNLDSQHRQALTEALALIPPEASLEAQSSILPHLSARRDVYEFPNDRVLEYVIVDARLPVTTQSRAAGFSDQLSALADNGYQRIFTRDSVQVFRRSQ